jgi:hypothetical protein
MPRGRPRKQLIANEPLSNEEYDPESLSQEAIMGALSTHIERGVKIEFDTKSWYLKFKKVIYNSKGKRAASGEVVYQGTLKMPLKDLLLCADELVANSVSVGDIGY